jgi:hypothetical protein
MWKSGAWVTLGSLQLQAYSGSAYTVLPLQRFRIKTLSPAEVTWDEWRYDASATSMVKVRGRLRMGSPMVELQVVVAAGQSLSGQQSVSLVNLPASGSYAVYNSADGTGSLLRDTTDTVTNLPGWLALSGFQTGGPALAGGGFAANLFVPVGGVGRFSLLAASEVMPMFGSYGTGQLSGFVGQWASYNRMRVRQILLVG